MPSNSRAMQEARADLPTKNRKKSGEILSFEKIARKCIKKTKPLRFSELMN